MKILRGAMVVVALVALLALTIGLGACAPEQGYEEPEELVVEDIFEDPTAEVDLTGDKKAARRASVSGQLPGNFPEGLPVFQPSAIEDVGSGIGGGFVHFVVEAGDTAVTNWYQSELTKAGWEMEVAAGGVLVVTRGEQRARLTVAPLGASSSVRVEY